MGRERLRGRPRVGGEEVGRDKIIARLRDIVRSSHNFDTSRKSLAEYAGVTPALISYYFPKKDTLLVEIVRPIISRYADELHATLDLKLEMEVKMHRVVKLLLNLYIVDGNALDLYYDVSRRLGEPVPIEVARMTNLLATYFWQKGDVPTQDHFNAAVLQGAVWGMCRFAARTSLDEGPSENEIQKLATQMSAML